MTPADHRRLLPSPLLDAVVAVGSSLELEVLLRRIVETATALVDGRYGAIGVLDEGGQLAEFIPVGLTEDEITAIHHWPEGKGVLGALISDPGVLRLADISKHEASVGFPPGHPPMRSFLGAPVRIRDKVYGNLYITGKQGAAEFDEQDEAVLVALASAAGVAIENARLYEEARRQQRWLSATAEVTGRLLSGADVAEALDLITAKALEITSADLVVLAQPAADRTTLQITHAAGEGAADALGVVFPASDSASGIVLESAEMLTIADFDGDERVSAIAKQHMRLGPAVMIPLGAPGDVRGVFTAGRRPGALPLSRAASQLLATFADQAAIGLQLAEHRRQAERMAIFEDRDRIARDLHDLVIQRLYATGMSLQGTPSRIGDPEVSDRVSRSVDALDETIREIRAAIFALQARPELPPASLRGRLLQVSGEMTAALGFAPALRLDGQLDQVVPEYVAVHLLSALREALSNAAKHASASRVEVSIGTSEHLVLAVRDDGVGMPEQGHRSGLANLAARAESLGGQLTIGAADGGGTELRWCVPLPVPGNPEAQGAADGG